jgi:hypothetical protein
MVSNSNVTGNVVFGLSVAAGQVMVKNSVLANGSQGVSGSGGTIWLSGNAIYGNSSAGVAISGSTVNSFGDNDFANNGTDVSGGSLGTTTAQ